MKIRKIQNHPYQMSIHKNLQVKHNKLHSQNYNHFLVIIFAHPMLFTKTKNAYLKGIKSCNFRNI